MRKMAWEKWEMFDEEEVMLHPQREDDNDEDEEMMVELEPIMIRTPIGVYSPFEPMSPSKMFDCWIFHTNFDITEKDVNLLRKVEGIEVLQVMSRYRAFVGIGKMFTFGKVREQIQLELCGQPSEGNPYVQNEIFDKIENIFGNMSDSKKWAIFLGNDGNIISITQETESQEDYELKLGHLMSLKNGNIFMYSEN
jgi:hypothetical protein